MKNMIKDIIKLTKPGIIFGNIVPCIAGYLFASHLKIYPTFFYAVFGAIFVIASGCVFNQIIDIKIDGKMSRTKNRPLINKTLSKEVAFAAGTIFCILGFGVLYWGTNIYAFLAALTGFIFYVFLYSFSKPYTSLSVYIGSLSGAVTVLIGYFAYNPSFTFPIILFFLIMIVWQLPHSFAIHIFNAKDYENANIPTIFSEGGVDATKANILMTILLFTLLNILFGVFTVSVLYLVISMLLCIAWVFLFFKKERSIQKWAKQIFFFSIIVIIILSIVISTI